MFTGVKLGPTTKHASFIAFAAALLVFTVLAAEPVLAQEPTPTRNTPPIPPPTCTNIVFEGPATRTINQVQVEVPAGSYAMTIPPPGSPEAAPFVLCHAQTGASITISGKTCVEISRYAPTAAGEAVLSQIISSCKVLPPPTPAPTGFSCMSGETVAGAQTITIKNSIQVTLPEGDFVVTLIAADLVYVCNADQQYDVAIRLGDCGRASIPDPFPEHLVLTNAIVKSCTLLHPVTPVPEELRAIRPPSTGNAGLASLR